MPKSEEARQCEKLRKAQYYLDNKEIIDKKHAQYYQDNREIVLQRNAQYYLDNRETILQRNAEHYYNGGKEIKVQYRLNNIERISRQISQNDRDIRLMVLTHYGLKCALCNELRIGALNIDHIFGNGRQHKRQFNITDKLHRWLIKHNFPTGFRTLCANCNWKEYMKSRLPLSMAKNAIALREQRAQIKLGIMTVLGGKCEECNCVDSEILTVQHTNNNGAEHRREISNGAAGYAFYKATLQSDDFTGLECYCFSCNVNAAFGWN